MQAIRLLDLQLVPPVRSQTIYHALAYAMTAETPDTIVLVSPQGPYVCIGCHQDAEQEVDLAYCRRRGLPVYRREVGGGAVYLDENQVFTQWVFHRDNLPTAVAERFALHIRALVETYRELGIAAYHRPLNDVHVAGRKIGGTGAASIGEAEVVVGSLMLDFDVDVMARVLKVPSTKMRDKVHDSLQQYITTMKRELGHLPDRWRLKDVYVRRCQAILGRDLVPSVLSPRELEVARELDERFAAPEWLFQRSSSRLRWVKVQEGVRVQEAVHKAPGGLIRVVARVNDGRIDDVAIAGDFALLPADALGALEQAVRGLAPANGLLLARLKEVYAALGVQSPGVAPEDFAAAVLAATGEAASDVTPTGERQSG